MRPAVEERLDVGGAEGVAGGLQGGGVGTREEAVVETLEPNALAAEVLLDPLVAVETELHGIRQVGADLEKAGTPVAVVDVEVVVIDRDPLAGEVEGDLPARSGVCGL